MDDAIIFWEPHKHRELVLYRLTRGRRWHGTGGRRGYCGHPGPSRPTGRLHVTVSCHHPSMGVVDLWQGGGERHGVGLAGREMSRPTMGGVYGDVAWVAEGHKDVMVRGVSGALDARIGREAGLVWVEPPQGCEEPMPGGMADRGVGVVEELYVHGEKIGVPHHGRGGDAHASFRDTLS